MTKMSQSLRMPTDERRMSACAQDETLITLDETGVVDVGKWMRTNLWNSDDGSKTGTPLPTRNEIPVRQDGLQRAAEPQDGGISSQNTAEPWRAKEDVAVIRSGAGRYDEMQRILDTAVELLKMQCKMIH